MLSQANLNFDYEVETPQHRRDKVVCWILFYILQNKIHILSIKKPLFIKLNDKIYLSECYHTSTY